MAATDVFGGQRRTDLPRDHLDAAISWLKRAHDMGGGGVSYGYCLRGGWRPPYPETSGYISVTLFELAKTLGDAECRTRAVEICRWLCDVQNEDGSISNPRYGDSGIVFDTGQVLEGFVRAFRETGDTRFMDAATRAASWLTGVADAEGRWTRNTFLGIPHVYNTRTAAALLELSTLDERAAYLRIARVNLAWAVEQQNEAGWFDQCGFRHGEPPFTHTIAYAIEGLLGAGLLLGESSYLLAARRCAESALSHVAADGSIAARIDIAGRPRARYACLTGNCQLALVWARLFAYSGDERFRAGALLSLGYVMGRQDITTADPDIRGAIKGSHPLWGRYSPLAFPSWAAKFFIDAMLLAWPPPTRL